MVALHTRRDDLHLVSHQNGMHAVLGLIPERDGVRVGTRVEASPSVLSWVDGAARIDATFDGTETVRLRGTGVGMRFTGCRGRPHPVHRHVPLHRAGRLGAVFTSYETGRRYRITPLAGTLLVEGDGALGVAARSVLAGGDGARSRGSGGRVHRSGGAPSGHRRSSMNRSNAMFGASRDNHEAVAPWRSERTPGAVLAAYVLWSATVRPLGYLGRESILMSKHWMDKVWS